MSSTRKRILLAGESWVSHTTHIKGFDSFTTSEYAEGAAPLIASLEQNDFDVHFLPNHHAPRDFPASSDSLAEYDVVILSDIGSNTLLLHPETFTRSRSIPNRCDLVRDFVESGGGLLMVGGYLSFSGIDGKARYQHTSLREVLPVNLVDGDDRVESPQGVSPTIVEPDHAVLSGLPSEAWPSFLGYNLLRAKPEGEVLATVEGNPFIAVGSYGKGRTAAFASDCGPHWGPPAFVQWQHYGRLWANLVGWLTGRDS